jgi:membrane associated rhomboid family serine protease
MPVATWTLIWVNTFIYLMEASLTPSELKNFLSDYALFPARYFRTEDFVGKMLSLGDYLLPFVTNIFLHGGWLHLILNMWTLWLFGPAVEDRLGIGRYLALYLVGGVLASVTHAAFNPASSVPALGASGAIAAVLGCYIRLFPMARIVVLVPILFLPLFFDISGIAFAVFWFVAQVLEGTASLITPAAGGTVAWWAHVGGFLAGLALAPTLRRSPRSNRPYYDDEGVLGFQSSGAR